MKLTVFTRYELADRSATTGSALLLEGSWRSSPLGFTDETSANRWALDDCLDGRFDWIDQAAVDLGEQLAASDRPEMALNETPDSTIEPVSLAYLNVLNLRYHLVKLLRPIVYFRQVAPLRPGDSVELVAASGRDHCYAEVLSEYCRVAGVPFLIRWIPTASSGSSGFPPNGRWRRMAGKLGRWMTPPSDRDNSHHRVVLCGNPRLLDPVCRELLRRRCNLWWLYDRFALKAWLRWQAAGVGQLVCNSSLADGGLSPGYALRSNLPSRTERFEFDGIDLSKPIGRWLIEQAAGRGPRQARLVEQIDRHFRRICPDALVLDEDATPIARAAVAIGRRHGITSSVVQHGVPCCRFGFAPLVADRILAWGDASRQSLIDWEVPSERIQVTGSPQHDCWNVSPRVRHGGGLRIDRKCRPPRILLLATTPPRDSRPDALSQNLTGRTHAQMLRMALAAVAEIPNARLIVKLHPRSPRDSVVPAIQAEYPMLHSRVVRRGPLTKWLGTADCVLSCGSSAGVEATLAGVPAIQLAPPGATNTLPSESWGFMGTARTLEEIRLLLAQALDGSRMPTSEARAEAFDTSTIPAAARVADAVLGSLEFTKQAIPLPQSKAGEHRRSA